MTPLAQFGLQQGLVITHIDEFVQFCPEKCYANPAKSIISDRRLADLDPDKQVLAFSQKLCVGQKLVLCVSIGFEAVS